uniref:Alanine--glyoxylate aminotransferase 2, mitochondrial n=1 Tax=Lutzomyia longipalpis TaxID=7200 RepID=A0A1B0CJ98_LUTLO
MNPDPYQGHWGGRYCRDSVAQTIRECECPADGATCAATDKYYHELEQIFLFLPPRGRVAGMLLNQFKVLYNTPRATLQKQQSWYEPMGGVFIADEVQSGFGRTGDHFWGFEGHGIIPDIVTCAKGIGNGFPIGAVITTPEIAQCLDRALHFNTYGGNPLASAVGIAVLDVIEEEELQKNSKIVGTQLLKGLLELQKKYEIIGDVRGKGLMIGVELVEDRTTRKPLSTPHVIEIWEKCKDIGVLLGRGGLNGNPSSDFSFYFTDLYERALLDLL